mgnify:CR=1 FL=1
MADEPVVVMKFQPVKPGNRVEDKTETTFSLIEGPMTTKSCDMEQRGEVKYEEHQRICIAQVQMHKPLDEAESSHLVSVGTRTRDE